MMTIQKVKSVFGKLGKNDKFTSALCYLIPFCGLGGYLLDVFNDGYIGSVSGYYLIHYLYTYDHGFVARGLVGEVLSWFHDIVNDDVTRATVMLFSILLMLAAVFFIGKALDACKNSPKAFWIVFVLCVALCALPGSFRAYYPDFKLDKLFWAITWFSVPLINRKYAVWLVPELCLISTLINPIYLFCSMILVAILLLQRFYDTKYSAKMGIICGFSYVSMIALGIYALVSEKFLGFETPREMIDYYFARYDGVLTDDMYRLFETEWLFDYFDSMDVIIRKAFQIYFIEWGNWSVCIADLIFLMIPTYTVLGVFWKKCMSKSQDVLQKIIFFFCLISPVVIILPIVFSWETSKYYYNNLLVQLSLLIYYISSGNAPVRSAVDEFTAWFKKYPFVSLGMLSYVAVVIIS